MPRGGSQGCVQGWRSWLRTATLTSGCGETPRSPSHRWRVGVKAQILCGHHSQMLFLGGNPLCYRPLRSKAGSCILLMLLRPPWDPRPASSGDLCSYTLTCVIGEAAQEPWGPGRTQDQTPAYGALGECLESPGIPEASHHPGGAIPGASHHPGGLLGRGQPLWELGG